MRWYPHSLGALFEVSDAAVENSLSPLQHRAAVRNIRECTNQRAFGHNIDVIISLVCSFAMLFVGALQLVELHFSSVIYFFFSFSP